MSRSYERFRKDLLARVKQNSKSDSKEQKYLTRKFKYFDRVSDNSSSYNDFSNVINRLNVFFKSKNEEFEVFNEILTSQKENGFIKENSKRINYAEFINEILEITKSTRAKSNIGFGDSSTRNNKISKMMSIGGSRGVPGNVTTTKFEKSVIVVSEGMCSINLLYVLEYINKEIKKGMGNRMIDYGGLLKCFMKIGLGFKYEVRYIILIYKQN